MAGAIPIQPTEQELLILRQLRDNEVIQFLTELDEHGWMMARAVLAQLASRRKYPMNNRKKGG